MKFLPCRFTETIVERFCFFSRRAICGIGLPVSVSVDMDSNVLLLEISL